MKTQRGGSEFDALVIGSGIGGLACACALTRMGYKVLVLERHFAPGGLTQTFSRNGFTWDVGIHYLGGMGASGEARPVIDWLSGGAMRFTSVGPVYDTVHFPGGFELQFTKPQAALILELKERFPHSHRDIDAFFAALSSAESAGRSVFAGRALPPLRAKLGQLWRGADIEKWWGRSTQVVLDELIADPTLRAVLAAQRGDYAPMTSTSSFGMHATVMRHYLDGAYYPVGGAKAFAEALVPVIEAGGGALRTRSSVASVIVEEGAAAGVRLQNGSELRCPLVFSDAGAQNTVTQLLAPELRDSDWAKEIASLEPSAGYFGLYLGLEGDVHSNGATASNHWLYESWDIAAGLWRDPAHENKPPAVFVSFPSMKGPDRGSAGAGKHTAELIAFTDWKLFEPWADSRIGRRPAEYTDFKRHIEQMLLAHFRSYFPALAPLIVRSELSTPLSNIAFTGAVHGGAYGLETSPRRFLSRALRPKTPIRGLFLAGQDVTSPGVTGAMMGGLLAAASVEPRVFGHLN
jgi:all-trans-retinol 13,14-reductase